MGNLLIQFKVFYLGFEKKDEKKSFVRRGDVSTPPRKNVKDCFLNVDVVLTMYLSLMVTNSIGENTLIVNAKDNFNSLALLSIESDILRQVSVKDILSSFFIMNCRRKPITH